MDLLAFAVRFFLLALLIEIFIDWRRGSHLYRSNDAINSLSAGILSTTTGYFTKFVSLVVWGYVLQNFALIDMPLSWFDTSPRGVALWLIAALGWDFCYYWNHRLGHEVSVLWAAHAVHHQSEDYNLSTALRQSSSGFLFGWIFYVPLFLIGFPLEVLITVNAVNLIYQFWVHTQIVRRMGVLDSILITPSNHRVHHAQNERYIDKNYGGMLVLWDRLFGTFEPEHDDDPVVFGVRKALKNWNPLWANVQVYEYLMFDALRTTRWRDKLGLWFRRTGWRPADVETKYPKQHSDLATFVKFDPSVSDSRRRYVIVQFTLVIAATLLIADLFVRGGAGAVFVPSLLLWSLLYSLGQLNQNSLYALRFERLRLLLIVPAGMFAAQASSSQLQITSAAWAVIAVYIIGSLLWLESKGA